MYVIKNEEKYTIFMIDFFYFWYLRCTGQTENKACKRAAVKFLNDTKRKHYKWKLLRTYSCQEIL